ncbi:type VII secretion target [Mycobacterium sp. DBP42]|uniref:type VII secretion target n=1 Tax=Mycobacteriaceae TaxID=1762 RepID=UPI00110CA6EA|nr:type VII secretion target [Mycobacterium sp. DBP42]TMS50691.1 hypothetical protein E0T84_22655 [Mycobacterium sp. DBP42]
MATTSAASGALNVNPADLTAAAGGYEELAQRAQMISPQAVDLVQKVIATHGPMGYSTAIGIIAGLLAKVEKVEAKSADFVLYAQRLTEHGVSYRSGDGAMADGLSSIQIPSV